MADHDAVVHSGDAAACEAVVQVYQSASGAVPALRGIDARFGRGTITVVMGPSGAGKSTLLRLLACLERPVAGEVRIGGEPTAHLSGSARRRFAAQRVGYVFQQPRKNLLEYLSVTEHVALAARMRSLGRPATPDVGPSSAEAVERAGLAAVAGRRPVDLSAGEQQRLAFTMAVAGRPDLVIGDEPTAELDPLDTTKLVSLLPALTAQGQTFVLSSHDPALIAAADRILVVRDGCLAAQSGADGELLAAVDDAGRIQLPESVVADYAGGTARLTVAGDGADRTIRIERP